MKLTGDITGSAVVAADGQWTIPVDGPVPAAHHHAVQTSPGVVDSPSVTRNFTVDRRPGRMPLWTARVSARTPCP